VLLVGDSWAFFMSVDQTINNAFRKWGHSNYRYLTNAVIAENGAETDDFQRPDKRRVIDSLIQAYPSIEVIHLSIGGNDYLGDWKVSNTPGQTDTLFQNVRTRLEDVIDFLKSTRPGIKVMWGGYTYPNFNEVLTSNNPLGTNHPFYGTWQGMEFPSISELNQLLNRVSDSMTVYANNDPQVEFFNATGLMQYTFGQTTALGIAPGGTYPAFTQPLPYGDPNYPSPRTSMRDYLGIAKDCFHLSAKGYLDMLEYHTEKFYHKYLMDDFYVVAEKNLQSGSVSSQGDVADTLVMGKDGASSFASLITFNTSSMLDTTLAKASVFLRRKGLSGTNPISGSLQIKIKSGQIGATINVEATDYAAQTDDVSTPCLFGSNNGNDHWIRLDLPPSALAHIKQNAITQIIIEAPTAANGLVAFYDGTNPAYAPVLNLKYGQTPTSINNVENNSIAVYPNPASNLLTIETAGQDINSIKVFDLLGKELNGIKVNQNTVNIAGLTNGIYVLQLEVGKDVVVRRFVKE
jgi:lysophospholipase L1-like esterase